ncbi:hypothetical protein C7Y69_07345 [Alteromonas sp. KS69]|nr:hypothetical protein C7Y69_07345 [Alteromonas sp. KS69]
MEVFILFDKLLDAFPANQSFFQLAIVKKTCVCVIFLFIVLLLTISIVSSFQYDLYLDFTYNGFNNLFLMFKFPLAILATLIPLLALYATNHRSEQTKKSINLLSAQNDFTNYHRHIELFEKHIENIINDDVIIRSRELHHKVFPKSESGIPTFTVDNSFEDVLDANFGLIYSLITQLSSTDKGQIVEVFIQIAQVLHNTEKELCCRLIKPTTNLELEFERNSANLYGDGDLKGALLALQKLADISVHILSFSDTKQQNKIISDFKEIDPSEAPPEFNYANLSNSHKDIPCYFYEEANNLIRKRSKKNTA